MKTTLQSIIAVLLITISNAMYAQAPQGMNYQAVVRDANGDLMTNQNVTVIFTIKQGTTSGTTVYSETQSVTTNNYGGFVAIIGQGTPITQTFDAIDWGTDNYFLNVNVDGNDLGTTQLLSVPYALYANTASKADSANFAQNADTATVATRLENPIWKTKQSNGDYFTSGKPVIIGDSISDAMALTVRKSTIGSGHELADFRIGTLGAGGDVINLEVGSSSSTNAQFIECNKQISSNLIMSMFKVNTNGSVYARDSIKTSKNLTVGTEVNRTNTGTANLIPIAYGMVQMTGAIASGTGNFTVTRNVTGEYRIAINGVSFNLSDYTVLITIQYGASHTYYALSAGKLIVKPFDLAGNPVNASFSFAVYKP